MKFKLGIALGAALWLAPALARADRTESPFAPEHQKLDQATALVVQGKYTQAEPLVRQALAIDPTLREGHYNLGVIFRAEGRNGEAIAEYKQALVGFMPGDEANRSKCLYGIALAAEASGDGPLAVRAWQDYIRYDSKFAGDAAAVRIAENHLVMEEQHLAQLKREQKLPGTQKAAR